MNERGALLCAGHPLGFFDQTFVEIDSGSHASSELVLSRSRRGYSNVATTGAWSLVPTSRCEGHDTAFLASGSLAST
jgi:hypothetical protein